MEKLMKYLLNEIIQCLTLSDFFKLKQLSRTIKSRLDDTQHLVLKVEAFNTFSPHLFKEDSPFRYVDTPKPQNLASLAIYTEEAINNIILINL
jgi:hypothetical protein